jgi:antitoxin component YwqK of YwqJK toxin-antitoxin module
MTDIPRIDFDELELVVGDDYYMFWKGQPFTGFAVEFFPDGTLRSEVHHVNGLRHGPSREWYPSGRLMVEANHWHGGLHGYEHTWNEQGRLISERIHEFGIEIAWKRWDEQGSLIKDWRINPTDSLYNEWQLRRQKWGQAAPPI